MARKTSTKTTAKTTAKAKKTNPQPIRAIDDNYAAPKRKPKAEKTVTLAEALAEAGQTLEEVAAPAPDAPQPKKEREAGTSNLANTIRSHRHAYQTVLHPNGKKTQNNGDAVAQALLTIPLADLKAFSAGRYGKSYDHLNDGHARMCIGNLIRGEYRKGEAGVVEWITSHLPKAEAEE